MVAELTAFTVLVLVVGAELLHAQRTRRVARLAFGSGGQPRLWARLAPLARAVAMSALAWGLVSLWQLPPKVHRDAFVDTEEFRHLLLVLDVSPSMRLEDAGPTKKQSRRQRAADLLESLYQRMGSQFKTTAVAVYNGAKPVVIDTTDMEVVRNILHDLPMHFAFPAGETRLFDGLEEAARIAHPWNPQSATLVFLTDGDTVPATGMPKLPASISHVLVVGVGDPRVGGFINGRHSRQDVSTLRQIATRLGGIYHDGNEKQISTEVLRTITAQARKSPFEQLTRREYALLACALGAAIGALLPVALELFGTAWRPGVRAARPAAAPATTSTQGDFSSRQVAAIS